MIKTEIIKLLREHTDYVSGQELCSQLGVSRTAVWKVMNQLKEEGYQISAISNKGYKLSDQADVLSKEELESQMKTITLGRKVVYLPETGSTNTYAKKLAEEPGTDGTLVVAEKQIQGKGRRGKSWESPVGTGIWMTLVLKPKIMPASASMLTLIAGLSVSAAISEQQQIENQIKWPNDIVIHGKKVCGILTEMSTEFDYINHVVVGIGINANMESFPEELQTKATSLKLECGHTIMRSELIALVMKKFELYYNIFLKTGTLVELIEEYNNRLANRNKEVVIQSEEGSLEAVALEINESGELIVRQKDGREKTIVAGEVSVRGIYGYV